MAIRCLLIRFGVRRVIAIPGGPAGIHTGRRDEHRLGHRESGVRSRTASSESRVPGTGHKDSCYTGSSRRIPLTLNSYWQASRLAQDERMAADQWTELMLDAADYRMRTWDSTFNSDIGLAY